MMKRTKPKLMYVPWDADALADALFETEDLAQARVLAKALATKMVDDTRLGKPQVDCLKESMVEAQAQEKTLTEALLQSWMRPIAEAISAEEPSYQMCRYLEC